MALYLAYRNGRRRSQTVKERRRGVKLFWNGSEDTVAAASCFVGKKALAPFR
jgi:hypothetical protein